MWGLQKSSTYPERAALTQATPTPEWSAVSSNTISRQSPISQHSHSGLFPAGKSNVSRSLGSSFSRRRSAAQSVIIPSVNITIGSGFMNSRMENGISQSSGSHLHLHSTVSDILLADHQNLLFFICKSDIVGSDASNLAPLILKLLEYAGAGVTETFINRILVEHMRNHIKKHASLDNLFRDNSLSNILLISYVKGLSSHYVHASFKGAFRRILALLADCELDEMKIPTSEAYPTLKSRQKKANSNKARVWMACKLLIHSLLDTQDQIPIQLRKLCSDINQVILDGLYILSPIEVTKTFASDNSIYTSVPQNVPLTELNHRIDDTLNPKKASYRIEITASLSHEELYRNQDNSRIVIPPDAIHLMPESRKSRRKSANLSDGAIGLWHRATLSEDNLSIRSIKSKFSAHNSKTLKFSAKSKPIPELQPVEPEQVRPLVERQSGDREFDSWPLQARYLDSLSVSHDIKAIVAKQIPSISVEARKTLDIVQPEEVIKASTELPSSDHTASQSLSILSINERIICSMLFLRVFFPVIPCPDKYGLTSSPISKSIQKSLILCVKILSALCNDVNVGARGDYFSRFNNHLDEYRWKIKRFTQFISSFDESSDIPKDGNQRKPKANSTGQLNNYQFSNTLYASSKYEGDSHVSQEFTPKSFPPFLAHPIGIPNVQKSSPMLLTDTSASFLDEKRAKKEKPAPPDQEEVARLLSSSMIALEFCLEEQIDQMSSSDKQNLRENFYRLKEILDRNRLGHIMEHEDGHEHGRSSGTRGSRSSRMSVAMGKIKQFGSRIFTKMMRSNSSITTDPPPAP